MNLDDNNLDKLVKDHLDLELSSQLGRAEMAFRKNTCLPQPERASWHLPLWLAGSLGLAAAITVTVMAFRPTQSSSERISSLRPTQVAATSPVKRELEYTTFTRTLDDGLVYLDDQTPVHQLRRQEVQQVSWMDADGKTQTKLTVPREDVYFIEYTKN